MKKNKKIYFASDVHLGYPDFLKSRDREKLFVQWLDEIKHVAQEIFLLGDVFDFWYEHKRVVPKGFTRLFGKIAEITDSGIPVNFFTGNHDLWIFDYLPNEIGIALHREPIMREFGGKRFYLGHGDGLGPGDHSYKLLKKLFTSKMAQWAFARLHPNFSMWLGSTWSTSRRDTNEDEGFLGEEKEWLILYAREILKKESFDYFIFGHRHIMLDYQLTPNCKYVNTGDWLKFMSYAVFDGQQLELKQFKK